MTRQTSRLTSLLQPPVPTNGYWGLRQSPQTSFTPNLSAQGIWVNGFNISLPTLQDATTSTPGVQFFMNNSYLGFESTFLDPDTNSNIYEQLFEYPTEVIGSNRAITSASFGLFISGAVTLFGPTSLTLELYAYDFGSTTESSDYRTKTWLSSATLLASITNTSLTSAGLKIFTNNGSNLINSINKTSSTRFVLTTSFHRTNTTDYMGQDYYASVPLVKSHCILSVSYS